MSSIFNFISNNNDLCWFIHIILGVLATFITFNNGIKDKEIREKEEKCGICSPVNTASYSATEVFFASLIPFIGTFCSLCVIITCIIDMEELEKRYKEVNIILTVNKVSKKNDLEDIKRKFGEYRNYDYKRDCGFDISEGLEHIISKIYVLQKADYHIEVIKESSVLLLDLFDKSLINGKLTIESEENLLSNLTTYNLFLDDLIEAANNNEKEVLEENQAFVDDCSKKFNCCIDAMRKDIKNKKSIFKGVN